MKAESALLSMGLKYVALLNTPHSMISQQVFSVSQLMKTSHIGIQPDVQYATKKLKNLMKLRLILFTGLSLPGKQ